jgi:hypothetical protein
MWFLTKHLEVMDFFGSLVLGEGKQLALTEIALFLL